MNKNPTLNKKQKKYYGKFVSIALPQPFYIVIFSFLFLVSVTTLLLIATFLVYDIFQNTTYEFYWCEKINVSPILANVGNPLNASDLFLYPLNIERDQR